jgi:hypothetical protein
MEALLISPESLKKIAYINDNVEDSIVRVIIERVQRAVVKPCITRPLYDRLVQGIDAEDLNQNEVNLLENYIAPLIAAAADKAGATVINMQLRNKGLNKGSDEYIQTVSSSESAIWRDQMHMDTDVAKKELTLFLEDNAALFPQYTSQNCKKKGTCSPINIRII